MANDPEISFASILDDALSLKLFGKPAHGLKVTDSSYPKLNLGWIHGFAMDGECCLKLKRPVLFALPVASTNNDDSCSMFPKDKKFVMWVASLDERLIRIGLKVGKAKEMLCSESLAGC